MRLLNRKVILSSITAVVLVTALVIIKPIPFTRAAVVNTISSNAPSDTTTTPVITVQPQQISQGNPDHIVITSNANPTTTPTDTPIVTPVAVQNQTNASSCHQVCQNVCN